MNTPHIKHFELKTMAPTRKGFGEGVVLAGERNPDIVGLGADITSSVAMNMFAEKFPERFFSLGVAEQNCTGVAAGLALAGKLPVFATYGVFAALRAADQVRISICYNNVHVVIGGAHAGISVGPDGATHQALEDIAIMRVLPNMTVLSPCDATQAKLATIAAFEQIKGPVYIRYGREAVPDFTPEDLDFEIGKGQLLHDGSDITLVATGHMVWEALKAAYSLEEKGILAKVINIHTIKPIDREIISQAVCETKLLITIEEHQVHGGLGSAVAEVIAPYYPVPIEFIGVKDSFGESGKPEELMEKHGLTASHIIETAIRMVNRNRPISSIGIP